MRLIFPASLEAASRDFPEIVVLLAQNKLIVTPSPSNLNYSTVLVECPDKLLRLRMVTKDFEILRSIAAQFVPVLSVFPSEPYSSIIDRARAIILVQFSGRGA